MAAEKTFDDWVKIYEQKTGTEFKPEPRARLKFEPEKGFAEYGVYEDMVVIGQVCGDAKYWKKLGEDIARQLGLNHLGTWCCRKIEPYIKLFDVEIEMTEDAGEGLTRYHCRQKENGKKAMFSPRSRNSAGHIVYMVTWEI